MPKSLFIFLACGFVSIFPFAPKAHAVITSALVDTAFSTGSAPSGQYDSASVTVNLDTTLLNWVAWNNAASVIIANASCQDGFCLGPGGFGTDDYIALSVINPLGASLSVNLDQNTALGNSFGPQNVIFGTAADAPDAIRTSPPFGSPANVTTIFNEAGTHNALFTTSGNYTFNFSWRNSFTGGASHPITYLLWDADLPVTNPGSTVVPEPTTFLLTGLGLLGAALVKRFRIF